MKDEIVTTLLAIVYVVGAATWMYVVFHFIVKFW
jgi:hypothetical protein